jgi:hypothetical protein
MESTVGERHFCPVKRDGSMESRLQTNKLRAILLGVDLKSI